MDYWDVSQSAVSVEEARAFSRAAGFGFEIGRVSRFENARMAVVIAKHELRDGMVNCVLLAEEIQHGLDKPTGAASDALRRGLTNEQFHAEVFGRVIAGHRSGIFEFLTAADIDGIERTLERLR